VEKEWIFQRIRDVQNDPDGRIDIWGRELYKSTIITFGKSIQDILASHGENPLSEWKGREVTLCIFSFNNPAAKTFILQIKQELENNEELKLLFPDILYQNPKKESPKWSLDSGLVVKRKSNPRESTVDCSGLVDGQPTGMHYLLKVYDDVVTLESARSAEMIKKTTQAWGLSLSLGAEGGRTRYVGTFYTDGDTYCEIIDRKAAIPRIFPATVDGKSSGKPVLHSQEYLDEKKLAGIYDFSCQYLCDPIPDDNAYFSINDFEWYDTAPENLTKYGASDCAVSEGVGDFTEMGIAGIDPKQDIYLLDWWKGQVTMDVWIDRQLDLVNRHKPLKWGSESGVIKRASEPFLNKRMVERNIYVVLEWLPTTSDKPAMCRSFQARAKQHKVYLPRNTPWADDLVAELLRFPKGKIDDGVDVCGIFGRMLDDMHGAVIPQKPQLTLVPDDYGMDEDDEEDWKTG